MRKTGNYNVSDVKSWYDNPEDFHKKSHYIEMHLKEIEKSDAILVVNDTKHDIKGYVGPNVIIEMGIAFYLKKPIYVLYPITDKMPTYEEVHGLNSIIIDGDLKRINI